jgi:hypothetical protein
VTTTDARGYGSDHQANPADVRMGIVLDHFSTTV